MEILLVVVFVLDIFTTAWIAFNAVKAFRTGNHDFRYIGLLLVGVIIMMTFGARLSGFINGGEEFSCLILALPILALFSALQYDTE